MNFFRETVNDNYFVAKNFLESETNLKEAAWALSLGQSVGNPIVRNAWETDELFENHSCLILGDAHELANKKSGVVKIAFPICNTDWETDCVSHLLCQLMGGQMDIAIIKSATC